jgi:DNA-binding NtrC family response regulator
MDFKKEHMKNLLIAEKDEDLSRSLALLFSDTYNVTVVTDFSSIIQSLPNTDILLLDESIIDYTGVQYLQTIKNKAPYVLIITMHTVSPVNVAKYAQYKQYIDASVFKPFEPAHLYEVIAQLNKTSDIEHL